MSLLFHLHEKKSFEAHSILLVTGYLSSPSLDLFIRIAVPCQVRAGDPLTYQVLPTTEAGGFGVREGVITGRSQPKAPGPRHGAGPSG